ncbi:MAG: pyrimidine utilization protein B [Candidatus Acidiferrum sp.]
MDSRTIAVEAEPHGLELNTSNTAVIVVDMQNDFGSRGGIFDRAGVDISGIQKAVGPTRAVLAAARSAGMKIVYLKMGYRPDLSDLGAQDSVNRTRHLHFGVGQDCIAPNGSKGQFLIQDTWNTDIVAELTPEPGDIVIYKHRFSGFFETDLDNILRGLGIRTLIFTGCTTSICVDSTLRDAMFRDYRSVLLADCSAEPIGGGLPRSNHEASLLTVKTLLGWVSDSERFLSALKASGTPAARSANWVTR